MKTTVIGAYPKISDEHQDLRRALHRHDRGELDAEGLSGVLDESTRWAIGELDWVGVDVVNDSVSTTTTRISGSRSSPDRSRPTERRSYGTSNSRAGSLAAS